MTSAILSGLLVCSGQTNTYDVRLQVDLQNQSITGILLDQEGANGASKISFVDLKSEGECLSSQAIKLCLNQSHREASLELTFQNKYATHFERGNLNCSPE